MNIEQEQAEMMLRVNPNIFLKETGSFGLRDCPKCGKLMEWHNKNWHCNNKGGHI